MLGRFADVVLLRVEHHAPIVRREREQEFSDLIGRTTSSGVPCACAAGAHLQRRPVWSVMRPGRGLVGRVDVTWLLLAGGRPGVGRSEAVWRDAFAAGVLSRRPRPGERGAGVHSASGPLRGVLAPLVEPVEFASTRAAELRSAHAEHKALEERWNEQELHSPPPLDPPPAQRVLSALEQCEAGDPDGFWVLALDLSLTPTSQRYEDEYDPDLTSLPGWQETDPHTRQRIVEAAKRYLRERDPEPDRWLGTNTWHRPAFAGYKALRLVLATEPEFISGLSAADWRAGPRSSSPTLS